jgi:hypothetical protein
MIWAIRFEMILPEQHSSAVSALVDRIPTKRERATFIKGQASESSKQNNDEAPLT